MSLRKALILPQNNGSITDVTVNCDDPNSYTKAIKGIRVNGETIPDLEEYNYHITVFYNVINRKGSSFNSKASHLAGRKIVGDALVVDTQKDLKPSDYHDMLDTLRMDAEMKKEAFEKAKTDVLAAEEANKVEKLEESKVMEVNE